MVIKHGMPNMHAIMRILDAILACHEAGALTDAQTIFMLRWAFPIDVDMLPGVVDVYRVVAVVSRLNGVRLFTTLDSTTHEYKVLFAKGKDVVHQNLITHIHPDSPLMEHSDFVHALAPATGDFDDLINSYETPRALDVRGFLEDLASGGFSDEDSPSTDKGSPCDESTEDNETSPSGPHMAAAEATDAELVSASSTPQRPTTPENAETPKFFGNIEHSTPQRPPRFYTGHGTPLGPLDSPTLKGNQPGGGLFEIPVSPAGSPGRLTHTRTGTSQTDTTDSSNASSVDSRIDFARDHISLTDLREAAGDDAFVLTRTLSDSSVASDALLDTEASGHILPAPLTQTRSFQRNDVREDSSGSDGTPGDSDITSAEEETLASDDADADKTLVPQ